MAGLTFKHKCCQFANQNGIGFFSVYLKIIHVEFLSSFFFFKARVAAGGLEVRAACQHGSSGAARILTAPPLQRACFSTSMYKTKVRENTVEF